MGRKMFTVQEANALLPLIRKEIGALREVKARFERKYIELSELRQRIAAALRDDEEDPLFAMECELEFLQIEASALFRSIAMKGVELKDIDSGLVDFPAMIGGREVLLCWKFGEERVEYYHGVHDGYAGRRRLTGGEWDE